MIFIYGALEWRSRGGARSAAWMGAGAAAMATTKETFAVFRGRRDRLVFDLRGGTNPRIATGEAPLAPDREPVGRKRAAIALGLSCLAAVFLFSGFGLNPGGALDFFRAFAAWTKTGTAKSGHENRRYTGSSFFRNTSCRF